MKWFDKLERKYGRYAIQNLMKYIIIVYAVGFVIQIFYPAVYEVYFALDAQAILQWTDLENFHLYFTATVYKHSVHCVCTVFLLHDWHSAGTKLGCI